MLLKAALYIRVSTEDQTEFSPDAQLRALRDYAKKNSILIIEEYIFIEDGRSGKTANRPKFQQMIKAAKGKPKPFDIILVHKFDRFARNREDSVVFKSLLRKECGIKVISITEQLEDDKFSVILEAMLEAMAEYYSLNLSDEVTKGMTEKALQGGYLTKPPLGYSLTGEEKKKKLTVNEEESWIVKKIYDMYLNDNKGHRSIAEELNSLGIKTRKGALWDSFPIKQILKNQVYIGNTVWNKTKRNETKVINRPEEEWIIREGTHDPIIDSDTFFRVQERLKIKSSIGGRSQASDYLLGGLIKCGHCGSSMTGNKSYGRVKKSTGERPVYRKYICSGYHKQGICSFVYANCDDIERNVFEYIKEFIGPKKDLDKYKNKKESDNVNYMELEKKKLSDELLNIDNKFQRQLEAYEDGIIDRDELKAAKDRVNSQKEQITEQLNKISAKLDGLDLKEINKAKLADFYDIFDSTDIQKQKVWFQQRINHIKFVDIENFEIIL